MILGFGSLFGAVGTITHAFLGFYAPVDTVDAAGNPIINIAEAGASIPMTWSLIDAAGNYVDALATVLDYGYEDRSSCAGTTDTVEEYSAAGAPDLRYDADSDQFILAATTDQGWVGSCKLFTLELSDGTKHQATFQFKYTPGERRNQWGGCMPLSCAKRPSAAFFGPQRTIWAILGLGYAWGAVV